MDPTGNHLIISTKDDTLYLHRKQNKPRVLGKLREQTLTAVGWDVENKEEGSTGTILFGTSNGKIYEAIIDGDDKVLFKAPDRVCRLIFAFQSNEPHSIEGIGWFRYPSRPTNMVVFITTKDKIYQFVGAHTFEKIFEKYVLNPNFTEMRGPVPLKSTEIHFFSKYISTGVWPKSLAWMTKAGIVMADLTFTSTSSSHFTGSMTGSMDEGLEPSPNDKVMDNLQHVPYALDLGDAVPVSMFLTEFHYMILYSNGIIQAFSRLTGELVYESIFKVKSDMIGISHDPKTNITFAYNNRHIFEIHVTDEDKNVWEMYLKKNQYDLAEQYCKTEAQRDQVWSAQGDYYFSQRQFELAAQFYGKTTKPFEEITLKFIEEKEYGALRKFVKEKLKKLPAKEKMQKTILSTWLTEMYLNRLNELDAKDSKGSIDLIEEEFFSFLDDHINDLDVETTFNLMSSHGRTKELLYFAEIKKDFDKVVGYHIQQQSYVKAIITLSKLDSSKLYYKYCPILMVHSPKQCVDALTTAPKNLLDPRHLIPALMRYTPEIDLVSKKPKENQVIRYLQHCVNVLDNKDPAVYNYLISLYAQEDDELPLLDFLKRNETYFDLEYGLRLCQKHNKLNSCVRILSKMGLYEEAVDLALSSRNIELAKQNAEMPGENEHELRKKLWLRIARHVVEEEKDITKAMKFLQNTDLLKIEDILPFFPNFVLIDDFKHEICRSLQEYNRHIEDLENEMSESTKSAESIRSDIEKLKEIKVVISNDKTCDVCRHAVITNSFYVFPCEHVYHQNCLADEMRPHIKNEKIRKRVHQIQDTIREISTTKIMQPIEEESTASMLFKALYNSPTNASQVEDSNSMLDDLQDELEKYIASECPLCGDLMIESISLPLYDITSNYTWDL